MAVNGELKGLRTIECDMCGEELPLQVCHSNAGYYLGHQCPNCGPYSRETGYFKTRGEAEGELNERIPAKLRNTDFVPTDRLIVEEITLEDEVAAVLNEELEEPCTSARDLADIFADYEACKDSFDDGDETVVGSAVLVKRNEEVPF